MKLVVEIDEETYEDIKKGKVYKSFRDVPLESALAIANGIPLPKGHGRIIDIGKIDEDKIDRDNPIIGLTINGEYIEAVSLDYLNNLSTIIEADNAESEDKE